MQPRPNTFPCRLWKRFIPIVRFLELFFSEVFTLIRLGFLRVSFSGGGQFDPPSPHFIFQEELI